MKYILLSFLLFMGCTNLKFKNTPDPLEYYYYSETAYLMVDSLSNAGWYPTIFHTTVNGMEYTCNCPPAYVEEVYRKKFPDVVYIAAKLPKNVKILTHR